MPDKPLTCSVVIPTYNRAQLLRHTLESLTRQTLDTRQFEVIVVDDGSSDSTADVVKQFHDRLDLHYFYQPDEGFRVAKARNVGITHARADVCVFIDSGLLLHPRCLAAHVAVHRDATGPVAVIGYVYGFNLDNEDADLINAELNPADPGATIDDWARRGVFLDLRERFYTKYTDNFADLPAPWLIYWTCNVSAATAQLRAVGAFDENFQTWGGEDLDLGYRLHRDGARFLLARDAAAIHAPHEKSYQRNESIVAANYRYIACKYRTPITQLLQLFPSINPFTMNDVIRELRLPSCAVVPRHRTGGQPGTTKPRNRRSFN